MSLHLRDGSIAIALLLALAGCGDDGDSKDSSKSESPAGRTVNVESVPRAEAVQFRRVITSSQVPVPTPPTSSPLPAKCEPTTTQPDPEAEVEAIACDDEDVVYRLAPAEIVGGIEEVRVEQPPYGNGWLIAIDMDRAATATFEDITKDLVGTDAQFAVVIDGTVISAPSTNAVVTDGRTQIQSDFTEETATEFAELLASHGMASDD